MAISGVFSFFRQTRLGAFLAGASVALIVVVGLWGPRLPLGSTTSSVVLALIEDRCMPHIRYRLPLNTSGLTPVFVEEFAQDGFFHAPTDVVLMPRVVEGRRSCLVSNHDTTWPDEEWNRIVETLFASGEAWVGEEYREVDLSTSHDAIILFRPDDGDGRFLLFGSGLMAGGGLFQSITLGDAVFQDRGT